MNAKTRLTHEERQQIAGWLAEGLGYAEIARRLGRPTSTISREVARNGTSGDYRAEYAQQAAGRRARRRKPSPASEPDGRTGAEHDFVDEFAGLLAATGMPRMTARVFTCLLTAEGSLTAADLVRRLRVSPASVSKSIAYLEGMSLVARQVEPGRRREHYTVADDVWLRAWQTDTGAHGKIATTARDGVDLFGACTVAGRRLAAMAQFFGRLSEHMGGSVIAEPAADDALTVLAALVHAGRPLALSAMASALGWPRERVAAALAVIDRRPAVADPLTVERIWPETFTVAARPDRLSPAQRNRLPG
ncbi:GbsR/MarR family transcriptional regulator [Labedaea rhizosphaerae]|uniref:MarR family protein n=1 Tax=Labedaea rhizosphaerae TaxID=598644 RepID=A0A4R6S3M2_LABRH|nr:helix-turn-helix domain-containing protein [Labedaea rhizosphaerae]TDP93677.1 MarR family protein [Labedaea rhizosphaerae]